MAHSVAPPGRFQRKSARQQGVDRYKLANSFLKLAQSPTPKPVPSRQQRSNMMRSSSVLPSREFQKKSSSRDRYRSLSNDRKSSFHEKGRKVIRDFQELVSMNQRIESDIEKMKENRKKNQEQIRSLESELDLLTNECKKFEAKAEKDSKKATMFNEQNLGLTRVIELTKEQHEEASSHIQTRINKLETNIESNEKQLQALKPTADPKPTSTSKRAAKPKRAATPTRSATPNRAATPKKIKVEVKAEHTNEEETPKAPSRALRKSKVEAMLKIKRLNK